MKNSDERKRRKRIDSRIFLKISKLLRKQFFPEETPRIAKIKFRPAVFFLFPSLFYEEKNVYYRNVLKYNPRPLLPTILFRLWRIDALFSKDRVTIFARRGEYICAKERKRGREMVKIKSDTWNVGQGDTVRCGKEAHSTIRVDRVIRIRRLFYETFYLSRLPPFPYLTSQQPFCSSLVS